MFKPPFLTLMIVSITALAAEPRVVSRSVESHTLRPARRDFSEDRLRQLSAPAGFSVSVFAKDQGNARMLLTLPDGTVLLTRHEEGEVVALRDTDADGAADSIRTVAGIRQVHGMALLDGTVYLASTTRLFSAPLMEDGELGEPREFATLPDGGQHPRRTMGFDDGGWLHVSIGSTCNACEESNPEHATMIRMRPDGSQRAVFARGLRNTIGFDWHPQTRALWGMDHGSDDRGDDMPPEELNLLEKGKHYGWPHCFADRQLDPITNPGSGVDKGEFCRGSTGMVLGYQAHSAPIAFVFYDGDQFPEDYRGDAFIAMHGSWNRSPAVGYSVVRVRFENGQPTGFEDFITGWLLDDGEAHFGRPAGLTVARDGSLLVSDDANGVIYRVSHEAR